MERKKSRNCCNILQKVLQKCSTIFIKQMFEFCRETGLHGCKYICETQRPLIERVTWAIMVLASVCIAIGMLKVTYDYDSEHSILSVIESTHHGIWNYPFPAVTVCDFNRVSLKLTQQFVDNLTLPPMVSKEIIIHEMKLLDELLQPGKYGSHVRNNLSRLQIIFDMNGLSIPAVMNSVTRNCQSLLESCKWKAEEKDCNTLFRPSLTRNGICCSFNYITYDRIMEEPKYAYTYNQLQKYTDEILDISEETMILDILWILTHLPTFEKIIKSYVSYICLSEDINKLEAQNNGIEYPVTIDTLKCTKFINLKYYNY